MLDNGELETGWKHPQPCFCRLKNFWFTNFLGGDACWNLAKCEPSSSCDLAWTNLAIVIVLIDIIRIDTEYHIDHRIGKHIVITLNYTTSWGSTISNDRYCKGNTDKFQPRLPQPSAPLDRWRSVFKNICSKTNFRIEIKRTTAQNATVRSLIVKKQVLPNVARLPLHPTAVGSYGLHGILLWEAKANHQIHHRLVQLVFCNAFDPAVKPDKQRNASTAAVWASVTLISAHSSACWCFPNVCI